MVVQKCALLQLISRAGPHHLGRMMLYGCKQHSCKPKIFTIPLVFCIYTFPPKLDTKHKPTHIFVIQIQFLAPKQRAGIINNFPRALVTIGDTFRPCVCRALVGDIFILGLGNPNSIRVFPSYHLFRFSASLSSVRLLSYS